MVLGSSLPDWVDPDFLKSGSAILAFVCAALVIVVFVWVRAIGTKVLLTVLLAAGVFGLFAYRGTIDDCTADCDCSVLGQQVHIDGCADEPDDKPGLD
ncbi:MAG: hypothetical protein ACT4OX_00325 [Actinomycetota bacterium]